MRWFLRVSLITLAGSVGCVGGPVSDWPARGGAGNDNGGKDDEDTSNPQTPINGSMDAGFSVPPASGSDSEASDGGVDGGVPCTGDAGACRASCAVDAGHAAATDPTGRALLGCANGDALDATD